jgi:chromate transporter
MSLDVPSVSGARAGIATRGSALEVGSAFLQLGLTSFGGPVAHIGYFRREFVDRRDWLTEEQFGHLLGLCQFLPGPASSQLGFCIGLLRAGWAGALAAFVGFTLPSAALLFSLAAASGRWAGTDSRAAIHGLTLAAVAVVGQALVGMARSLTPDAPRALLAAAAAAMMAVGGPSWMQFAVIATGAALGPWLCRRAPALPAESLPLRYGRRTGAAFLILYGILLMLVLLAPTSQPLIRAGAAFYRAGALVFGGGHVVLPLLQPALVGQGWIEDSTFLAGYGATQAVPGPLFTVAAFLGERLYGGQGGIAGAVVCLCGIFLPGFLIVAGALPYWQSLGRHRFAARMLAGVNAAVVGILAAALYDPVWVSAVEGGADFATVAVGFGLLTAAHRPWWAVLWCLTVTLARAAAG